MHISAHVRRALSWPALAKAFITDVHQKSCVSILGYASWSAHRWDHWHQLNLGIEGLQLILLLAEQFGPADALVMMAAALISSLRLAY